MKKKYETWFTRFPAEDNSLDAKLWTALHHTEGADERLGLLTSESTDAEVKAAISREFGISGGSSLHGGFAHKGGAHPAVEDENGRVILSGKGLIQKTRKLLNLDDPTKSTVTMTVGDKSVTVNADKFAEAAKAAATVDAHADGYSNPAEAAIAEAKKMIEMSQDKRVERSRELRAIYGHIPECKKILDANEVADAESPPRKSRITKTGMTPNFVTEPCPPVLAGKTCWKMASPFLRRLGQKLINDIPEHRHLCEARILLLVKQSIDPEKKDDNPAGPKRVHLGKAGKTGPRDRLLSLFIPDACHAEDRSAIDFWIWVNGDWLESLGVKTERDDGETHWTEGSLDIDAAGATRSRPYWITN